MRTLIKSVKIAFLALAITSAVQSNAQAPMSEPVAAALCAAHFGGIGYIQTKQGNTVVGAANLKRFSFLDSEWGHLPEYVNARKNIDANLAKDPSNMGKNLGSMGQACRQVGMPTAQF